MATTQSTTPLPALSPTPTDVVFDEFRASMLKLSSLVTKNIRIKQLVSVTSPHQVINSCLQLDESDYKFIAESRKTIENILSNNDLRLLVIVGPCSIHNVKEALEYANRLATIKESLSNNLFLVMRTYFEKPRTSIGWKGLIYDPDLNGTNNINKGLLLARNLLVQITKLRIPVGVEFLDTITPQYLADIVSWGAIGARTTESQIHRQLASGLSMPVGFKNLTDGNIDKALNGIKSAQNPHTFLGINDQGIASIVETEGNPFTHLILRGGSNNINYDYDTISKISGINKKIIIDCSHDNSRKEYKRQVLVAIYVMRLKLTTNLPIGGIMLESNINEGKQEISKNLKSGISITDACIDWESTKYLLKQLSNAVVYEVNDLASARNLINTYDAHILNNDYTINLRFVQSSHKINVDDDIIKLSADTYKNILYAVRLAISERVADIKLQNNPEIYLKKSNSILENITKLDIETSIIEKFNNQLLPNQLAILDISKKIQTETIKKQLCNIKIGYLFGSGSFSGEAVDHLHSTHLHFNSVESIYKAIDDKRIDYGLIPIHNIKIGPIFNIPAKYNQLMQYSIPINLTIYANIKATYYECLYIEPHIEKEIAKEMNGFYLYEFNKPINEIYKNKKYCSSTREGILLVLNSDVPAITIASSKLRNPLLIDLDKIEDPNNRTYFSLISS